jgi:hypothetical protein
MVRGAPSPLVWAWPIKHVAAHLAIAVEEHLPVLREVLLPAATEQGIKEAVFSRSERCPAGHIAHTPNIQLDDLAPGGLQSEARTRAPSWAQP